MGQLQRLLSDSLATVCEGGRSNQAWRLWGYRSSESMNGNSENFWRLSVAERTVLACQKGNREEAARCAELWRLSCQRDRHRGTHGTEAFGHYRPLNWSSELVSYAALNVFPDLQTQSELREQLRAVVGAWSITAIRNGVARRLENSDRHGDLWEKYQEHADGPVTYRGPLSRAAAFRHLPWAWSGLVDNLFGCRLLRIEPDQVSRSWKTDPSQRAVASFPPGSFAGVLDNRERDLLRTLVAGALKHHNPQNVLRVLGEWRAIAADLRCVVPYDIFHNFDSGLILSMKQDHSAGNFTGSPHLVFQRRSHGELRDCIIAYPFIGNRVRGRKNIGTGWATWTDLVTALVNREMIYTCRGHHSEKAPKARTVTVAVPMHLNTYRISLFPSQRCHVSRIG